MVVGVAVSLLIVDYSKLAYAKKVILVVFIYLVLLGFFPKAVTILSLVVDAHNRILLLLIIFIFFIIMLSSLVGASNGERKLMTNILILVYFITFLFFIIAYLYFFFSAKNGLKDLPSSDIVSFVLISILITLIACMILISSSIPEKKES
jgi:hypothetical protein